MPSLRLPALPGLLFLHALAIVIGGHAMIADVLLFHSDALSLLAYLGAAGTAVSIVLGPLAVAIWLTPPGRRGLTGWLGLSSVAVALGAFLLTATILAGVGLGIRELEWLFSSPGKSVGTALVIYLAGLFLVARSARRDEMAKRASQLGTALLVITVFAAGASVAVARMSSAPGDGDRRHLVLAILDGMPPQFLRAYDASAVATTMDEVVQRARLYLGARTTAAWTHGFFGVLWSGRSEAVLGGDGPWRGGGRNLMARLQAAGVNAQWIVYHRNGIPEASAAATDDYRGLRSYLLTERYGWIPRWLGLPYHLVIYGRSMSKNFPNELMRRVFNALNPGGARSNAFVDELLPDLRRRVSSSSRTFTLFHIRWTNSGPTDTDADIPPAWDDDVISTPRDRKSLARIKRSDNHYEPRDEPLAEVMRRRATVRMGALGRHLSDFLDTLANDPALSEVQLIVTADHGSMFRKGRFWYGKHPNEEVLRVPFLAVGFGAGIDERVFATPELTASILDTFNAGEPLDPKAEPIRSLRSSNLAYSMTQPTHVRNEWFVVILHDGRKYVSNVHPEGDGITRVFEVHDFQETAVREGHGIPPELRRIMPLVLAHLGFDRSVVHPSYR